jgi:hypothetical protein
VNTSMLNRWNSSNLFQSSSNLVERAASFGRGFGPDFLLSFFNLLANWAQGDALTSANDIP